MPALGGTGLRAPSEPSAAGKNRVPRSWYESCCVDVVHPLALAAFLALSACGSTHAAPNASAGAAGSDAGGDGSTDSGTVTGRVELGVPGGTDGLEFTPLQDGDTLKLETFGQGGVHVLLGVRCVGFGSRAFIALTLENLNSGTTLVAPAPARPQLLFCDADAGGECDLVPVTVMAGGLTQTNAERNGLPILVTADVHNVAGVTGQASKHAVLSTADL